jgi:hypothetical protein
MREHSDFLQRYNRYNTWLGCSGRIKPSGHSLRLRPFTKNEPESARLTYKPLYSLTTSGRSVRARGRGVRSILT